VAFRSPEYGYARSNQQTSALHLFPSTPREQTGAVFAALLEAASPINAASIAATFRQGRKVEAKVAATLAALARLGHLSATGDGKQYWLPRAA
jgi:hypothetical protein